jgi:hypothetical protein
MRRSSRFLSLSLTAALAGVVLVGCGGPVYVNNPPPTPTSCVVPTFGNYTGNYVTYNVSPGAGTDIPAGDRAFAVTSNGNGTYRLVWTDTAGYSTCFTGLVTTISNFGATDVSGLTGQETTVLKQPNQIAFASVPGSAVHGIDFFAAQDPVYVDVYADNGSAVDIYYPETGTNVLANTGGNIAAFFSP